MSILLISFISLFFSICSLIISIYLLSNKEKFYNALQLCSNKSGFDKKKCIEREDSTTNSEANSEISIDAATKADASGASSSTEPSEENVESSSPPDDGDTISSSPRLDPYFCLKYILLLLLIVY